MSSTEAPESMTPRTISKNWDLADLVSALVDSSKMISPLPEW